jgi:hypothetical protein
MGSPPPLKLRKSISSSSMSWTTVFATSRVSVSGSLMSVFFVMQYGHW